MTRRASRTQLHGPIPGPDEKSAFEGVSGALHGNWSRFQRGSGGTRSDRLDYGLAQGAKSRPPTMDNRQREGQEASAL